MLKGNKLKTFGHTVKAQGFNYNTGHNMDFFYVFQNRKCSFFSCHDVMKLVRLKQLTQIIRRVKLNYKISLLSSSGIMHYLLASLYPHTWLLCCLYGWFDGWLSLVAIHIKNVCVSSLVWLVSLNTLREYELVFGRNNISLGSLLLLFIRGL